MTGCKCTAHAGKFRTQCLFQLYEETWLATATFASSRAPVGQLTIAHTVVDRICRFIAVDQPGQPDAEVE